MASCNRRTRWSAIAALAVVLLLSACGVEDVNPSKVFVFSFESGTEGWYSGSADDNAPVDWNINRAVDMSSDSVSSMRFYLDNANGNAKIWIERMFSVDEAADYRVQVSYHFATRDYGSTGLWKVLAGAGPRAVSVADELVEQGDTGNGSGADIGFQWRYRTHVIDTKSSNSGKIFVSLGIWGTTVRSRVYYYDQILVSFTRR